MKRAFDVALSLAGLVLLAPVMLVVALAVKLGSAGPAFFRAERVGRDGRRFRMHKFRTMSVGIDGPRVTTASDRRVTGVGRFLRRTRLDEIPQLWNVLVGDMSLVGPRPEEPRFADSEDPRWRRVLSVRPGLTGPTQLAFADCETALLGPDDPERDYRDCVLPAKLRVDLEYVERRTFGGDIVLLVRTLFGAAPTTR